MLGIDIFDASLLPAILVSLSAGLISFLSPCVLPIVPPYLAYMSGISLDKSDQKGNIKVVLVAASFVLGLSTVFLILGIAASSFGILVLAYKHLLNTAAGLLIMCFGLHFLGIIRIPILNREVRFDAGDRGGSFFGAYLGGVFKEVYGSYDYAWYVSIALSIFAGLIHLPIRENQVKRLQAV